MAKLAMLEREKKRIDLVKKGASKRLKIKENVRNLDITGKLAAQFKLQKQSRNTSKIRIQRRCGSCGRPHAVYRRFRLCRICLRQAFCKGLLPGMLMASW